jgi:hypothetical protein
MRKIDKMLGPAYKLVRARRKFVEYPLIGPVRSLWGNTLADLAKLAESKRAC